MTRKCPEHCCPLASDRISGKLIKHKIFQCFRIPFIGGVIIFDAAFHVLQLIEHSKHVDELPQSQQICLRDKVLPALRVTQTTDFPTETIDCCPLQEGSQETFQLGRLLFRRRLNPH